MLKKRAEKVIDELLEWGEETREPNLTQIEGKVKVTKNINTSKN